MRVALTFDDGPSEWTEELLDVLLVNDSRATFFVCGREIEGRENTLRRMNAEGHEIGNHTWSHPRLPTLGDAFVQLELERTNAAVLEATGIRPRLWRPPHFDTDERVDAIALGLDLTFCGCDVDPADWMSSEEAIFARLSELQDGDVVDLHDGMPRNNTGSPTRQPTVNAVRRTLENGLRSYPLPELVACV